MDQHLSELLHAWRGSGEVDAGEAFLRARLRAGTLDWGSVEAAAFLDDPASRRMIGEDVLAITRPGKEAVKTLVQGVYRLAGPSPELELRLVLGALYVKARAFVGIRERGLDLALAALNGEARAVRALARERKSIPKRWPQHNHDGITGPLYADVLAHVAERVGPGPAGYSWEAGSLVDRLLPSLRTVSSGVWAHRGVDKALLPWLLTREVQSLAPHDPALEEARSRRLAGDEEELFLGGRIEDALAEELYALFPAPGIPWHPLEYAWLAHTYYRHHGWTEAADKRLVSPSGRRRLRLLGTKTDLEELQPDGTWICKPTLRGLTIWNKVLGMPLRLAAEAWAARR